MLWIKALHIIAVISWFAGLLYLPRLFVYHAACREDDARARFSTMESRLYWRIMTPAMLITIITGPALAVHFSGGWLATKYALVAVLLAFHASCYYYIRRLQTDRYPSDRFFRLYNEFPTVLLIAIVILVVVKPY